MSTLALADVRWRSRRDPNGGPPLVTVTFLPGPEDRRMSSIASGIGAYVASFVGRHRRDYDTDVPTEIAGDRRLGNGLAAVCIDWYRWQARTFAEAMPAAVLDALIAHGVDSPSDLRLRLFDLVNAEFAGFVPSSQRDGALTRLAATLNIDADRAQDLAHALTLDAEAEAVLSAVGPAPSPDDIVGRYNRALLAAMLRQAERIVFTLAEPDGSLVRGLYALCRRFGVYCDVEAASLGSGFRLTLAGPDRVVGPPAAAGRRLAVVAMRIIDAMDVADAGVAHLILHDRPYRLTLDRKLLAVTGLRGAPAIHELGQEDDGEQGDLLSDAFDSEVEARLAREFSSLRRQRRARGWKLVREPAPVMAGSRVLIPDFALLRGGLRVFVEVVGFWTPGYIDKKRRALDMLDSETPLVLAIAEASLPAFRGLPFPVVPYRASVPVNALLDIAESTYGDFAGRTEGAAARLEAACAAATGGWLSEAELTGALGCVTPGEVARVLSVSPEPTGWTYLAGAGLCGPILRDTLGSALTSIWAERGPDARLSPADVRGLLPDAPLPKSDTALLAVLACLPECELAGESLFDTFVRPAGAAIGRSSEQDRSDRPSMPTPSRRPQPRRPRRASEAEAVRLF